MHRLCVAENVVIREFPYSEGRRGWVVNICHDKGPGLFVANKLIN
jgi:hypothetical protein